MHTLAAIFGACLLLGAPAAGQEGARPAPWHLKFSHDALETITIPYKDGSSKTVYFMTFTLKNTGAVEAKLNLHITATVGTDRRKRKRHLAMPHPDAENVVRRISNTPGLLNVQSINKLRKLGVGKRVRGIAVFDAFNREWDEAVVAVSGLEPYVLDCRIRAYGNGFTLAHRAYYAHNSKVLNAKDKSDMGGVKYIILKHNVQWSMKFTRAGDEFAPHLDAVDLVWEGWTVSNKPAPRIVLEKKPTFGGG